MKKTLLDRLRKSVTRVNPKVKKSFKTLAKAHGVPKKTIKGALRRPGTPAKTVKTEVAAAEESPAPEKRFSVGEILAQGQEWKRIYDQLRTTGGRTLRRKKK